MHYKSVIMKYAILIILASIGISLNSCSKESKLLVPLTEQEKADLLFLREEEKMAFDIYTYAFQLYGLQIFNNISNSEQRHMNSVLNLLDSYGIPDPVGDHVAGEFSNPEIQSLYDELATRVDTSATEALKAGATIEDVDIYDIQRFLSNTNKSDLTVVYNNLACGSKNHLRSFVGLLGGDYTPQYISQSEYDAIISDSNGPCGGN